MGFSLEIQSLGDSKVLVNFEPKNGISVEELSNTLTGAFRIINENYPELSVAILHSVIKACMEREKLFFFHFYISRTHLRLSCTSYRFIAGFVIQTAN